MITANCEGCYTRMTNGNESCRYIVNDGSCPCSECIVKSMCNDSCEDFSEYVHIERRKQKIIVQEDTHD